MQTVFEPELLPLLLSYHHYLWYGFLLDIPCLYRGNECHKRWLYCDEEDRHGISILETCATYRSLDEPWNIHA